MLYLFMSAIILTPLAGRKQMRKVAKGSIKVMKRGRKPFVDDYLTRCIDEASDIYDIVATRRAVPNTIANKNRVRARVLSLSGKKKISITWYTEGKLAVPVLSKK
jgi:hypothetical protein